MGILTYIRPRLYTRLRSFLSVVHLPSALKRWYWRSTGKRLNLRNPKTFNEKIQWAKLYDSTPLKTRLADKYLVREWVAEKIGEQYLIPLLGVYKSFEEIDFNALPNRFVMKCNHGSAMNLIVKDKHLIDMSLIKEKFTQWLDSDFSLGSYELHYANIPRRIIIEEYIENDINGNLLDYKFWCFNGEMKYVQLDTESYTGNKRLAFFDKKWKKQNFSYNNPLISEDVERPDNFEEMLAIVQVLAEGFPHVRVDIYRLGDGRLLFGEMTFTHVSGIARWSDESVNIELGDCYHLPKTKFKFKRNRAISSN